VSSPLDDDFAVMVHKNNVEERGPYWVGQTKWDNSWALWEGQGSKADVTAPVHNWAAEKVGDMVLDGRIFNFPIRKDLMHQYVRWQLAKLRQGTAKTMTRAEKRGGGRKPRKQKGSGMARIGSTRSPLMPGGGHAKAKSPKVPLLLRPPGPPAPALAPDALTPRKRPRTGRSRGSSS